MAIFTNTERNRLELRRLIFHVVGPGSDALRMLPEIAVDDFAEFFLDRLRENDSGNQFRFRKKSQTLADLREIQCDDGEFVTRSEDLARRFQELHTKLTSAGVFMLMHVVAQRATFFALVKYDHEEVLHYMVEERRGTAAKVIVERLRDTFVRSRDALQKCAIARMTQTGQPQLNVVDRSVSGNWNVTKYFKDFLGVERIRNEAELTDVVCKALEATAVRHRDDVPKDRRPSVRRTVYRALRDTKAFDENTREGILSGIFGPLDEDAAPRKTFERELERQDATTESFAIDHDAVPTPERKRIRTKEGIEITYPTTHESNVNISSNGRRISITTEGIEEDDDIAARNR